MGLFDFVSSIGKKLFHGEEEAGTKIKEELDKSSLGLENLEVEFKEGTVKLRGRAPSWEAFEKAVLIAGNIEGVSAVDAAALSWPPLVQKVEVEYYIIQKGDTLSQIAKRLLGEANRYEEIFEANREVIKDADLIFPGQKIRVPRTPSTARAGEEAGEKRPS